MRIGITTYLNSSFSGIVINALELASPRLTCNVSTFRFASTSSRYVTLNPTHTHALLLDAVDDRRRARANHETRAAVDAQLHRFLVAEREHHVAGHAAFLLAAACEMVHATEAQHLRTVFRRRHIDRKSVV